MNQRLLTRTSAPPRFGWLARGILACFLAFAPAAHAQFEARAANTNHLDQRQAGARVVLSNGSVTGPTIVTGGIGYNTVPAVTIAPPPGGTQAEATATVSGGAVTGLTITEPGSGYTAPPLVIIAPPTTLQPTGGLVASSPQFAAMGAISGASGLGPATTDGSVRLVRSSMGAVFSSGVPRYFLGDEITPPLVDASGRPFESDLTDSESHDADLLAQARAYWRAEPIGPGELSPVSVAMPQGNVPANTPLRPALATGTYDLYYWSRHAEKVYANQPGGVRITWITQQTESGIYRTKAESFAVSAATNRPVRTIFWTERSFDGPRVPIRDGRVSTVAVAYHKGVPALADGEVVVPGVPPVSNADPDVRRQTLWVDLTGGQKAMRAYNVEGRVLIEYLGGIRRGADILDSLGVDVVEIVRAPTPTLVTVNLGKQLLPHDGDLSLLPAPKLNQDLPPWYGTLAGADGQPVYHAERQTGEPAFPENGMPASLEAYSKVIFYWLQPGPFASQWPKYQDRYWQRWSPALQDYAHYTVDATGSSAATGISFSSDNLPSVVYQDTAAAETVIDSNSQRLYVNLTNNTNGRNRSLLKFSNGSEVWYVNLYTQRETRQMSVGNALAQVPGFKVRTYDARFGAAQLVPLEGLLGTGASAAFDSPAAIEYNNNFNLPGLTNGETFSIVWQGWFDVNKDGPGSYTFGTASDDGSVIFFDLNGDGDFNDGGELVVNNNGDHGMQARTGTVTLPAGSFKMAIGFYESAVSEAMTAKWKKGANLPYEELNTIQGFADGPFFTTPGPINTLTLASTLGIEPGMIISGGSISTNVTVVRVIDDKRIETSAPVPGGSYTLTVQSDDALPINANVSVGERLTPPAGHEVAGFISGGVNYYAAGYRNPFVVGVPAASQGAIIPVNALPTKDWLTVRWYKKISAPTDKFQDFYVPGKFGRYTASFPSTTIPQIIIAEGIGTGDLAPDVAAGTIYEQAIKDQIGYNPNEEHALIIGNRAYALRDDLNMGSSAQSAPFALIAYTSGEDNRPAMKAYKVLRELDFDGNRSDPEDILLDRPAVAGTLLVAPYPLPLMPLPMVGNTSQNVEVTPANEDQVQDRNNPNTAAWDKFTMKDRKGFEWVFRGPHAGTGNKRLQMQYRYVSRKGFTKADGTPIPEGTILPFLRPLNVSNQPEGDELTGAPLTINFNPAWPANAPELRVGETLTLPKFGLPQVRGQKSAVVFYQQSIAQAPSDSQAKASVTLHDPTREKVLQIASKGLLTLPSSIATSDYLGKKYFQRLAPDLQERIYFDPLRGSDRTQRPGTLVLIGEFKDEIAGEDYLHLNVLTAKQIADLKALCTETGPVKSNWNAAIDALNTNVQTFVEDTNRLGTYKVGTSVDRGENELATITNSDTAVDSYALTATGSGAGWVTMVFGNGKAFTPEGDPVQVKVFKVAPTLYTGELKTIYSKNPLDEQVTLRHTGDFAARPQDYEFEWKWAPGGATAPATYTTSWVQKLGAPVVNIWTSVRNPRKATPSSDEYTKNGQSLSFPRAITIRDANYKAAGTAPALVLKTTTPLNLAKLPGDVAFSANMGDLDGFVLYVNGDAAIANLAPAGFANSDAIANLVPGNLQPRQFRVPPQFFRTGNNDIEIALFTSADANSSSFLDFRLDVTEEVDAVAGTFQSVNDPIPNQKNTNVATISADPSLPFGGSTFVLNDRWFTMRYRPLPGNANVAGSEWSRWMPPQFVEGWIKRVLRDINPFEQRVKDLFTNAISTDTSVLTQAGKKWEGDIALTLDNIENVGLIEIYETVLNRARSMSIDSNTNDPDTNNALMLAAGYLSDLYSLLGNEAFADAANPTISTDDENETTEINTSRFSFENQVASFLDEELALLRGRDASGTRVDVTPAYNRLYWNFTGGINAGEALYATNYNIKEKAGSSTADGVIDAADAQRMFPQGHGDAYGHYLTALKGYYRLLSNKNFTWQRRAEAVLVLGQAVTVDFVDERKFAGNAANVAKTAEQICALTSRQNYVDGEAGWTQYRDTATAPNTAEQRNWGLDEWSSRSAQGAYYNWVVANAMLPDVDSFHTGVEKIDRTTVPELNELASSVNQFQTVVDNASARLNPLGLSSGAIPFDLDSTFLEVGSTAAIGAKPVQGTGHFGQIYERAKPALINARGAFEQAARMTRSLRNQENTVDEQNAEIVDQERTFRNQLIEIFGRPYEGSVGPGKTYAQGYYGPDLEQWFVVDRPNDLVDTTSQDAVTFRIWTVTDREFNIPNYVVGQTLQIPGVSPSGTSIITDYGTYTENGNTIRRDVTVTGYPNQFIQYSDKWQTGMGARPETGELQTALLDAHREFLVLKDALYEVKVLQHRFLREGRLMQEMISTHQANLAAQAETAASIIAKRRGQATLAFLARVADDTAEAATITADALGENLPKVVGLANDVTAPLRGIIKTVPAIMWMVSRTLSNGFQTGENALEIDIEGQQFSLEQVLDSLDFSLEQKQAAYELENLYRELTTQEYALAHPLASYQAANERVAQVLGEGQRVLEERAAFRKRAAAVVQGYRTKDVTFRVFRNEALEQYRSLFDLASRYSYLAAKAYDYDTGLLGTQQGRAFISSIVSSRSLGDIRDGDFFATTSTLGDNGLGGSMARLIADYRVAEGRLGINNPDIYSTIFSLRGENFRILDDASRTDDDEAWRQTLEQHFKANLLADPDVAAACRNLKKPNGTPVPGIIIPFSTTIQHGLNFFGLPLAAGDHAFTPTTYSTKIQSLGIALPGYVGMDEYAVGDPNAGGPALSNPDALAATPYLYVIPVGTDYMLAPLDGPNVLRSWQVEDQSIPLPFNLGANAFNTTQMFDANDTLSGRPWVTRQHQAFRPVSDPQMLLGDLPTEFTSHRLVGRSVWNSGWKIVIPAYTMLNNEQEALNRFARTVRDIRIFIRTYSYGGN